jgi:hypothetical protein
MNGGGEAHSIGKPFANQALPSTPRNRVDTPRRRRLIEMALAPNDPEDGWLTAKRAARQTKVERVTASRDLARFEESSKKIPLSEAEAHATESASVMPRRFACSAT